MKAMIYEVDQTIRSMDCVSVQPSSDEVQISVAYAGICGTDLHLYHGRMDHRVSMTHQR